LQGAVQGSGMKNKGRQVECLARFPTAKRARFLPTFFFLPSWGCEVGIFQVLTN